MGLEDYHYMGEQESGNNIDIRHHLNYNKQDSGSTIRKIEKNENKEESYKHAHK